MRRCPRLLRLVRHPAQAAPKRVALALGLLASLGACGWSGTPGDAAGGGAAVAASGGASTGGGGGSGGSASGGAAPAAGGSDLGGAGPTGSGGATPSSGGSASGGSSAAGGSATLTVVEEESDELLSVRQEHGVATFAGEIYVLGGFTPDDTATVEAYSPSAGSWRPVKAFPALFHHPNVAAVGDFLYVLGFHLGGGNLRVGDERSFRYDPGQDEWFPRASLPDGTGRGSSCVAVLGTSVYLFGGSDDPTVATSSVYDTVDDVWDDLPDLPEPRDHCFAAAIGGLIYIVGGRDGGIADIEQESWVFDPVALEYDLIEPMPTLRAGVAGGVLGGRIFVVGGEGNESDPVGVFHDVESYDPLTNTWTEHADQLVPRHGFGGAVLEDRLYLAGGATAEGFAPSATLTVLALAEP